MAFCRHDLCSWIPTALVLVRVGSCYEVLERREHVKLHVRPRQKRKAAENYVKSNTFCAKKKKKIVFGEEHATSHIQVGTAVTELAKYILQGDIWQLAEL